MIEQENKRLENLVENILQNSLLEKKDLIWEGGPIQLVPVCERIVNNAKFRVDSGRYKIDFEYDGDFIQIQAQE